MTKLETKLVKANKMVQGKKAKALMTRAMEPVKLMLLKLTMLLELKTKKIKKHLKLHGAVKK